MNATFFGRARRIAGVAGIAAFSALVLVGCGKDDDGGGKNPAGNTVDSALNGTWVSSTTKLVLKDGNFTMSSGGVDMAKGTYSTNGNNMTITKTSLSGASFEEAGEALGLSPSQWYTQQQIKAAFIKMFTDDGLSQGEAEAEYRERFDDYVKNSIYGSKTYTRSDDGNTLTGEPDKDGYSEIYTKQ